MNQTELTGVPAVDVTRGERVESTHAVAACTCDDDGRIIEALGAVDVPVFLRSAAKPFIAAAVVRSGAAERFGFTLEEIALMCGSHNGEAVHAATAAAMLAKIGASEADLACGATLPADEAATTSLRAAGGGPSALYNNCSGKHAGILALARVLDAPLAGYLELAHPAQQAVIALCERAFDERFGADRLGIDGCGIPVFATSLATAARTFARFATLRHFAPDDRAALAVTRDAMIAHPWFVGGTDRFDTDLMRVARGRIAAKAGAEGVHAAALLDRGIGLVVKVVDGSRRAVAPAAVARLIALGALDPGQRIALDRHARTAVRNVAGTVVGEIRARG